MLRLSFVMMFCAALGGFAQASDGIDYATSYVEGFDISDTYLTGALKPASEEVWNIRVEDGAAWFFNSADNSALRYYDLPAVLVPLTGERVTTDGAAIEARVIAEDAPDGGVGVLIGYPRGNNYLVFAVGADGSYRILKKDAEGLKHVEGGVHQAIVAGAFNDISVERGPAGLNFFVNGAEIFTFETTDAKWQSAPVGMAVFGRGRFGMDRVTVRPIGMLEIARAARQNACALPMPGANDELVSVGIYEGQGIASVSLAGLDGVTSTASLEVESGDTPIYLVVNSYDSLLWRLEGDTGRIAHMAVIGPQKNAETVASGVVGLDAEKISFHAAANCMGSEYDDASADFVRNNALLAIWTGHEPSATLGTYDLHAMSVPSGEMRPVSNPTGIAPEWDEQTVAEALRFSPAGLYEVEPSAIVTDGPVTKLKTLPQEFGLAQLVAAGTLVREGQTFRIAGPMRYPAGLYGAHSVDFALPPGVPEPSGDLGHSDLERLEIEDMTSPTNLMGADSIVTLQ